jgi:hypothetical protein
VLECDSFFSTGYTGNWDYEFGGTGGEVGNLYYTRNHEGSVRITTI